MKRSDVPRPSVLLVLLLVSALVACGGSSSGAPTSAGGTMTSGAPSSVGGEAKSQAAAEPTVAAAAAAPAAAVSAPAAVLPTPAASGTGGVSGADAASEAALAGVSTTGGAPIPPPERAYAQPSPVPQTQQDYTPLKAGEVDDNADFAAYQQYLREFYSPPGRTVDISERYILTVLNDQQQPVLDARVRVLADDKPVFEGRTFAGGETILFPRAAGATGNERLRVVVEKGNSSVEGFLKRGQDERQTFVLNGAEALPQQPRLDVMFLLDATGSMGDEIGSIQQTIVTIAERIDKFSPRPALRFGLVAYRDRGDEYVTRVYDFTPDVEAFRQILLSVQADGGGDEPEALNEGLHAAIQRVNWADDAVRLTFLVADAPPHLDYANDFDYVQEVRTAVARGVKIYPIAASNSSDEAEYVFRRLAQQTLASFLFLTYQPGANSGTPGESTVHNVDPDVFTVERLDDLVVQVVQRELAQAVGAR